MPKNTFLNLPDEKKQRILQVLKAEFQSKPFQKINIKTITDELQIARGSFYQYFENLEDSYFMILDMETTDIHHLFMKIFAESGNALHPALLHYGRQLADILFQSNAYQMYKQRYLYWTDDLNRKWNERNPSRHMDTFRAKTGEPVMESEKVHFIKAVIHSIIERNFQEGWSKDVFLEKYQQHIQWLEKGVHDENL